MGNFTVKDVVYLLETSSILASEDEPIESVIERFAKDLRLRGIFVVDSSRRFMGVVTRFELLLWTRRYLGDVPEDFDWKIIDELKAVIHSAKAVDMVRERSSEAYVHIEDPVSKALSLMMRHRLNDLPVLNDAGEIIGDLKLPDILNKIMKDTQTELNQGDV
ncbi:hypothetical protein A3K69_01515 [Candidatus Bathyarchaeota archaeon RBG_16_57_9]|nr:MAG: hypothetical protein A3K69_01515 [Candidatus Bathyarchaeota archaeon RBG_16_57_9]